MVKFGAFLSPKVSVYNKQKTLKISSKSVKDVVKATLTFHNTACEEIAIHFISTPAICKLHEEFFDDPSTTDCISFPYNEDSFLGEVFVCPETALNYVEKKGNDPYEETTLYVVHGILHLLGYDDIDPADRKEMKKEEKRTMAYLAKCELTLHH